MRLRLPLPLGFPLLLLLLLLLLPLPWPRPLGLQAPVLLQLWPTLGKREITEDSEMKVRTAGPTGIKGTGTRWPAERNAVVQHTPMPHGTLNDLSKLPWPRLCSCSPDSQRLDSLHFFPLPLLKFPLLGLPGNDPNPREEGPPFSQLVQRFLKICHNVLI